MESLKKGLQHTTINNKVLIFDDDENQSSSKSNKDASNDEKHMWNLSMFTQIVNMTQHEAITLLKEMVMVEWKQWLSWKGQFKSSTY